MNEFIDNSNPKRRIHYVDVSKLSPKQAEEYITNIKNKNDLWNPSNGFVVEIDNINPERRIHYIDISKLSLKQAEEYMNKLQNYIAERRKKEDIKPI